jgi:hypothetical protein
MVGLLVSIGSAAMLYYNWHTLMTDGHYNPKMSELSPLGMELGLLIMITPPSWFLRSADPGTPAAARRSILGVGIVFGALVSGLVLGFVNLQLMTNYKR